MCYFQRKRFFFNFIVKHSLSDAQSSLIRSLPLLLWYTDHLFWVQPRTYNSLNFNICFFWKYPLPFQQ
uniref:Uncharacterized protein n=1 Tax=Anguilla anguilla TaxID=7936 RepID=A0A0E9R1Y8_ANGAN